MASKKNAQKYSTLSKQTLKTEQKNFHFASSIKMLIAKTKQNKQNQDLHKNEQQMAMKCSSNGKEQKLILKQHKVIMKIIIIHTKTKAPTSTEIHKKPTYIDI